MKNLKKLLSMCLALMMVLTCVPAAFAAEVDDCTIDEDARQIESSFFRFFIN